MFELYPFASHFFDLAGQRLHYIDEGNGDPVVMLHGNPTWSFYYHNLVLSLRDSRRTIVPDHIGCGKSDKPPDTRYSYTLKQRIDDLERLLDSLHIDNNITLIVHDWGGAIGMGYAVRHPQRIARLVVLNTAGFLPPADKPLPWSLWLIRSTPLGPLLVRGLNAFCRGAARWCCTRRAMTADVRKMYLAPYDSWANRVAVLRFVQDIPLQPGHPTRAVMEEIDRSLDKLNGLPMLICWGMRDFVFDRWFLEEWRRRFPHAEVHEFADAGHYVLEDAADEIVPLVKRFVN